MNTPTETCDECGFDADEWNDQDTERTVASASALIALWTDSMPESARNVRPSAERWSVNEYVDHLREVFFGMRMLIELALEEPGRDLGPMPKPGGPGPHRTLDSQATASGFETVASALATSIRSLEADQWSYSVAFDGLAHSATWASRHSVHDLQHHLADIADIRVSIGDATPADEGTVAQINSSDGGVPKRPVDHAIVDRRGVVGDSQNARQHHGRPWQALCLWSAEVIADLQAEGHPIGHGSAGENLTLQGLEWSQLRAGTVLEIGSVRCQLSAAALPCAKNARWFSDRDFNRIHHTRHPERTRWYASVLSPGEIRRGDAARVVR